MKAPSNEERSLFKKHFKKDIMEFADFSGTVRKQKFVIDIFKFDDYMHDLGYDESKHGSLKSYLEKQYGSDVSAIINDWL